ncbi:copper resistance CopC family protein [Ilumatobacter coccineus]|nr:copper resistance protein CopC [Ilumatobacter coccineus]
MLVIAAVTAAASSLALAAPAAAHDDIASSVPADRSVIDAPISSAEIDFGEVIGDSVELFLTYDPGDGSTVDVGGETTKTGDTTARVDFPELTVEGTYFLRYLAPVPSDGHVMVGAISFTWGAPTAIDEGNDDVRFSSPRSRERIDEPITFAELEFDFDIDDDIQLDLVYDRGDGENFDELGGTTTKTGPSGARLDFDLLEDEGTYFIRYTGTATASGGEVRGATSFTYGDPSSSDSGFPVLPFALAAALILGAGAWFSLRRANTADDEIDDDDTHADDDELTPA